MPLSYSDLLIQILPPIEPPQLTPQGNYDIVIIHTPAGEFHAIFFRN